MRSISRINWQLGIPSLISEWKSLFSKKYLGADLVAGVTVAFVAIPLSLAIALASGVSPGTAITTAIIAGVVCALFGGTTLAVSGPAAAMSVLIASAVESYGMEGLVFICLLAGLMQLLSGVLGLGRLTRYVPFPVVSGFTAGIGVIILIGQLPRAFGLLPPAESHTFDVFRHIGEYFHEINYISLILVIATIAIIRGLPRIFPKVPAILAAVTLITLTVYVFHIKNIATIGDIPRTLPGPSLPTMGPFAFSSLLFTAFTIYILASLETLLSSSAIDKISGGKKHDSNQELIGQGVGNVVVSLFGGMPVTGVIARSVTNVRAGAKTRRASIIHSLVTLLVVFAIAPVISLIPIAALAGVLFSIAFSMVNYWEFYLLWKTARSEAVIYIVTFLTIIFVDLVAGIQAGIIASAIIILLRIAKTNLNITTTSRDDAVRLSLSGSLTFLSIGEISKLETHLETTRPGQTVILDLSSVTNMDSSGANAIVDLYNHCKECKLEFYIKGLHRQFEPLFKMCNGDELLEKRYLVSESQLKKKDSSTVSKSSRGRLIHGIQRFYMERHSQDRRLFEYIAKKQDPHTLFITCSDSRIIPSSITQSEPGELFIIRNVGNFIPPYNKDLTYSEAAALDFSLSSLDITDVVICGHASCGAIQACCNSDQVYPHHLQLWISLIRRQLKITPQMTINDVAKLNVLNQVANLKQYPSVQKKLASQGLNIHAWFFDFNEHLVYEWDAAEDEFKPIKEEQTILSS